MRTGCGGVCRLACETIIYHPAYAVLMENNSWTPEEEAAIQSMMDDWEARQKAKAEQARLQEADDEISLMKLVQEWGLAITRNEAQQFLQVVKDLQDICAVCWPDNAGHRRDMMAAFAVMLQICNGNQRLGEQL